MTYAYVVTATVFGEYRCRLYIIFIAREPIKYFSTPAKILYDMTYTACSWANLERDWNAEWWLETGSIQRCRISTLSVQTAAAGWWRCLWALTQTEPWEAKQQRRRNLETRWTEQLHHWCSSVYTSSACSFTLPPRHRRHYSQLRRQNVGYE